MSKNSTKILAKTGEDRFDRRDFNTPLLGGLPKSASILAFEVGQVLGEEMDDLNVTSSLFRSGMERCFSRVLSAMLAKEQRLFIFPDAIPGYSMLAFKKTVVVAQPVDTSRDPLTEPQEMKVIETMFDRFFQRNRHKVLLIDSIDLIVVLFPFTHLRKSLKEMDLYIPF